MWPPLTNDNHREMCDPLSCCIRNQGGEDWILPECCGGPLLDFVVSLFGTV